MRLLSTRAHGVLDYLMGLFLIASPWLFGFEGMEYAKWIPVGVGATMILYSLLTNYELGAYPAISMNTHLWLDAIAGGFLASSPWIFGFSESVYLPHLILGLFEIGAAVVTDKVPSTGAAYSSKITSTSTTSSTTSKVEREAEELKGKVKRMYKDKGDEDRGHGRRAA